LGESRRGRVEVNVHSFIKGAKKPAAEAGGGSRRESISTNSAGPAPAVNKMNGHSFILRSD
jgi:hypothetical protein